jgi:imidazolonepropionase
VGSLEIGKKMDLVLWDVPTYPYLVYHLGVNPVKHVIKNGKIVVEDGRILKTSVRFS